MKVLFVSASPINMEMSIGNTFLNVMPESMELASLYTRSGYPDKRISNAFKVSEKMIIKKVLNFRADVGEYSVKRYGNSSEIKIKKKMYFIKKRWTAMFWIQDIIWCINVWKSRELKGFINDFNPDIIFTLFTNSIFLNRIILYVLKLSEKPLVLYAWDNNYNWNKFQRSPLKWINQYFERAYMRKVMNRANKLYVISDIQKQDYDYTFQKESTILTKGADFSQKKNVKKKYNIPLQFVYTGNLGNNRWKSLAMVANALEIINAKGIKAQLKIYTATPLTREMKEALNRKESSLIVGTISASEISQVQENADVLVHAEAFDSFNSFVVKYSFSTKIVDYLAKGICILAIGPKEIASIDYFVRNNAGLVASSMDEVFCCLNKLILNPNLIDDFGMKAYSCAKKNHDNEKRNILRKDFSEITI